MGLTGSAILTFNYSFENQLKKYVKRMKFLSFQNYEISKCVLFSNFFQFKVISKILPTEVALDREVLI